MSAPAVIPKVRGPLFCGANKTDGSGTCRQPAGKRTGHPGWGRCWKHGGATRSSSIAAANQQAAATAQLFGVPRDVDPLTGMLETYHQTMGILDAVEAMCMQLLPAEVAWGLTKEKRVGAVDGQGDGESLTPPEQEYGPGVNVWVKLLAEWHDRAFKEAEAMLKLDLESRRLSVDASHIAAMVAMLMSPELALTEDQRRAAARLLRSMDQRAIEGEVV